MPANLSPEYKKAEAAFRRARDPRERLDCLREMLRTIPKHKGTEHLQADIKTRMKQLNEELSEGRKAGARRGPTHVIRPEGAAQIALLGPPNTGKSALHARLTGSHAEVAPYPFTTSVPQPGMLPYEDIHLQLVDLPPIARERPLPWMYNALQPADAAMLVVDLQDPECVERVSALLEMLRAVRVTLLDRAPDEEEDDDPFAVRLQTLLVANKSDLAAGSAPEEVEAFQELLATRFPALAVSAETGEGVDEIARWWFRTLGIVRVYTKVPGHPADMSQPFTLRRGDTVRDVARQVHGELSSQLRFARLWNRESEGLQVSREHAVDDGDVIELHA